MAVPSHTDPESDVSQTLYLVFAGLHAHAAGGTADLVAATSSPEEAQRTFQAVRLKVADREGWAELTSVSADGTTKRLRWFGVDRRPRRNPLAAAVLREPAEAVQLSRWRQRRGRRRSPLAQPSSSGRDSGGVLRLRTANQAARGRASSRNP